ncbi:hypothetical protein LCGC14_0368230 [marine sediment metagenome]|uniref:NTP pyrophosphohydrolase MazG putative catalytic core domain-containing protein n=1 Tax=marine sediment metagenome TaxID=412755 RepID=A0A0F9VT27_9ZZZZ
MVFDLERADKLAEKAIKKWGVEAQLFQTMEEMAELIHALSKWRRQGMGKKYRKWVLEELTDVTIMMQQISYMLRIRDKEAEDMLDKKLNKLEKKLK